MIVPEHTVLVWGFDLRGYSGILHGGWREHGSQKGHQITDGENFDILQPITFRVCLTTIGVSLPVSVSLLPFLYGLEGGGSLVSLFFRQRNYGGVINTDSSRLWGPDVGQTHNRNQVMRKILRTTGGDWGGGFFVKY